MKTFSTLGGTRLTLADDLEAGDEAIVAAARRREPGVASDDGLLVDALFAALAEQSVAVVDRVAIAPGGSPATRRRRAATSPDATLEVSVGPEENAVVLVERDGVYSWQAPDTRSARSARRDGVAPGGDTLTFTIGAGAPEAGPAGAPVRRGWIADQIVDAIVGPVRVYVLKFAARALVNTVRQRLEEKIVTGLVVLAGDDAKDWTPKAESPALTKPADRPQRILLFVHGTFSSTTGSFGALAATPWGRRFLSRAQSEYDAIIGYDHATLGETPQENAIALLKALQELDLDPHAEIDAVAFSRGGLVFRVLVERLLVESAWPCKIRKAVFVGCTNGGTALADPKNWKALLDLYTNLALAAGRALSFFDAGTASTMLTETVKTLGGLVQAVVDVAIGEEMVPGLAAMRPDSVLIADINGPTRRADDRQISYFAIGSDFEPKLIDKGKSKAQGLPEKLVRMLADGLVDRLMNENNDLVVDTEAMGTFGSRSSRLTDKLFWPQNTTIFHTNYFQHQELVEKLAEWLDLGSIVRHTAQAKPPLRGGENRDEVSHSGAPGSDALSSGSGGIEGSGESLDDWKFETGSSKGGQRRRSRGNATAAKRGPAREAESLKFDRGGAPPRDRARSPLQDPAQPAEITCHFAAEMPEISTADTPAELTVSVSGEALLKRLGPTVGQGQGVAFTDTGITLEVTAKANCDVVSAAKIEIAIPAPGRVEVYDFKIKGRGPGPGEVWVDARQGARRLTRIVLQPTFIEGGTLRSIADVVTSATDAQMVELRVYESSDGPNSPFSLRFVMESRDLDLQLDYTTEHFNMAREPYVKSLYNRLEGEWGRNKSDFDDFMLGLRAFGGELYQTLVPVQIRQAIWDNRNEIGSIEIISHEPFIPWEVLHIVEPGKPAPLAGNKFLAELGLVRWINNAGVSPTRLRVRSGRAHYVIPDYADARMRLSGAADEVELLEETFGADAVEAKSIKVVELLAAGGAFDLLHFACHGNAEGDRIWDASLLMAGRKDTDGAIIEDRLDVSRVSQYADLKNADGSRPVVFLNACQAGATGRTLTGTGGMADAFVRRGAGLFVGTLWSVGDETALTFAREFYTRMKAGKTVTEATRAAREAAKVANEPTWLAYTVYGNPYARIEM